MPDRDEWTRARKAVAKDPLADLGELTGVLRRVRPAAPPPDTSAPKAAMPNAGGIISRAAARDARAATVSGQGDAPGGAARSPRELPFSAREAAHPFDVRRVPAFEFLDEPAAGESLFAADEDGEGIAVLPWREPFQERAPLPAPDAARAPVDAGELERRYEEGKRYAAAGDYEKAIDAYHEVLRHNPAHVRARNNLGFAYDCRGDFDLAINEYRQALELDPRNVQVYCNLAAVYGAKGSYAEAEELLKAALRLDPRSAEAHCNLGILYCKKGLYHLAAAELKRTIELDGQNVQAFYYLGECYNHLERVDDAIEAFERALQGQPQNHKALFNLGILFDKKRMPERARSMYRRASEIQRGGGHPAAPLSDPPATPPAL